MSVCVLVVDKSQIVRDGLRFMLAHAGMEVVEASTCRMARQMAERSDLDAVLLDISVQDGDGFDLLAHLKATRPDRPVLIHTYYHRQSYVARAYALGASGYFVKGLDNHALLESLHSALNQSSVPISRIVNLIDVTP
jgi:two-component system response regulator GlrR